MGAPTHKEIGSRQKDTAPPDGGKSRRVCLVSLSPLAHARLWINGRQISRLYLAIGILQQVVKARRMLGEPLNHLPNGIRVSTRRVGKNLFDFVVDTVIYLMTHETGRGYENHAQKNDERNTRHRRVHQCEAKTGGAK